MGFPAASLNNLPPRQGTSQTVHSSRPRYSQPRPYSVNPNPPFLPPLPLLARTSNDTKPSHRSPLLHSLYSNDGSGVDIVQLALAKRRLRWRCSRLRLANHDGQTNWNPAALEKDVALDLEAKLFIVGIVGQRARLEIRGSVFGVGLLGIGISVSCARLPA